MARKLAFVLGGGGARGALQVGALKALIEESIFPDMLVGTSAGGVNSAFLAMRGYSLTTIDQLALDWEAAAEADLLPSNYLWLTVRILFERRRTYPHNRMRDYFIAQGVTPELRFRDMDRPELILVTADLNNGRCLLYGEDPEQSVLEGLCATTALPPWIEPMDFDGHLLMDGGLLSVLPIEPALRCGATDIIALDISDHRHSGLNDRGFGTFLMKLNASVNQRHTDLELALAVHQRVPVHHIFLQATEHVPIWDFSRTHELVELGYEITRHEIQNKKIRPRKIRFPFINSLRVLRRS
jgi:NTE family protein